MAATIALIGFGEAAETFALAAGWAGAARAFDIAPIRRQAMDHAGVAIAGTAREAVEAADLVLSLVTADQSLAVAEAYAPYLQKDALWFDMNSVAPETKRRASGALEKGPGRYVDAAILAPVKPGGLHVPLLLSGECSVQAAQALSAIGFGRVRNVGDEVGTASTIKMIRSVMVKGIEALTDEMLAAAQSAGVVDEVLASLVASERPIGWPERARYNRERMETHGMRRAAEMEESAKTLRALGVEPLMTERTVQRQRMAAGRATRAVGTP